MRRLAHLFFKQIFILIYIAYWFALNNVIEIQNINIVLMDA